MISLYHDPSAAARPTVEDAKLLLEQCLNLLQGGDYTADEIAAMLRKSVLSVRPRISELSSRKLIFDSGKRRKNESGCSAVVWTTKSQGGNAVNCFLHPERAAVNSLTVPCAPGGKIHLCAECNDDPNKLKKVWAKYKDSHAQNISLFKTPGNPGN